MTALAAVHPRVTLRPQLTSIQRARLCLFESEEDCMLMSAAITPTIVVCVAGDAPIDVEENLPVVWVPTTARLSRLGDSSWEAFLKAVGHPLASSSCSEWSTDHVLQIVRTAIPEATAVEPTVSGAG